MPGTTVGLWQAGWLTATAYIVGDQVTYGGGSYICIQAHTSGAITPANTSYWSITAAQGAAGATGPAGVSGFASDATTAAVGALLLERATALAHPKAIITDSVNVASGVAGLDANTRLTQIGGTASDFGNDYLGGAAADGTDMGFLVPRNMTITSARMRTDANPAQIITATVQKNGANVATLTMSTGGVVATTSLPQSFVAGDRILVVLSGTAGVTGLSYVFLARLD